MTTSELVEYITKDLSFDDEDFLDDNEIVFDNFKKRIVELADAPRNKEVALNVALGLQTSTNPNYDEQRMRRLKQKKFKGDTSDLNQNLRAYMASNVDEANKRFLGAVEQRTNSIASLKNFSDVADLPTERNREKYRDFQKGKEIVAKRIISLITKVVTSSTVRGARQDADINKFRNPEAYNLIQEKIDELRMRERER